MTAPFGFWQPEPTGTASALDQAVEQLFRGGEDDLMHLLRPGGRWSVRAGESGRLLHGRIRLEVDVFHVPCVRVEWFLRIPLPPLQGDSALHAQVRGYFHTGPSDQLRESLRQVGAAVLGTPPDQVVLVLDPSAEELLGHPVPQEPTDAD